MSEAFNLCAMKLLSYVISVCGCGLTGNRPTDKAERIRRHYRVMRMSKQMKLNQFDPVALR